MKKHYETHVEDTDKLISVAGPELDYKSWYEQYRKLMEERAQRKYGLYTPTSEGDDDDFPSIPGMIARYSALGLTNEQMKENPVWVDKTGNGHDLQMKNFLWGGMSGVGGVSTYYDKYEFTPDKYYMVAVSSGTQHARFTFKVTGLVDGNTLSLADANSPNNLYGKWTQDGIYTVDIDVIDTDKSIYFYNGISAIRGEFTIEILPLYPGALVFDGVDDYGTCDNFPILTKEKGYTVVALRKYITPDPKSYLISNGDVARLAAFLVEGNFPTIQYWNFGAVGNLNYIDNLPYVYQTSKEYNGRSINKGDLNEGIASLLVCKYGGWYSNAAIWELVFLDHDATEEELTKIKDYFIKTYPWLFPDQAWTVTGKTNEDEDRATIANITGNGNDLVLSNFGFAGGSGYGLYFFNSFHLDLDTTANYTHIRYRQITLHNIKTEINSVNTFVKSVSVGQKIDYTVKISGLTALNEANPGFRFINSQDRAEIALNVSSDGIYHIQGIIQESDYKYVTCVLIYDNGNIPTDLDLNVTIEQIPEYEGYLVTDGVDDKIASSAFGMGKDFTVVGEWKFIDDENINAGLAKPNSFFLYNKENGMIVFINKLKKGSIVNIKSLKAVCSDGRVYTNDWQEIKIDISDSIDGSGNSSVYIANRGTSYTQMAFKNLGIYNNQILSKDDCIKAYIYLQTLKAK